MKPITKIIIFLVVAFALVIIITVVKTSRVVAPATTSNEQATTTAQATQSPSTGGPAYTLADVAKHKTATDCWTVVGGNVYDLSAFVNKHPGGVQAISQICGIDGTVKFTQMHGSTPKAQQTLATLKIGVLSN